MFNTMLNAYELQENFHRDLQKTNMAAKYGIL